MLTLEQVRNRTKTVTRRKGWWKLKPGEIVNACAKCMGLKRGEKIEVITQIRIVSTRAEPLGDITQEDVIKEGFPQLKPEQFVSMFMEHNHSERSMVINRIEFEYVDVLTPRKN